MALQPLPDVLTDTLLTLNQRMHQVLKHPHMSNFDKVLEHRQLLQQYRVLSEQYHDREQQRQPPPPVRGGVAAAAGTETIPLPRPPSPTAAADKTATTNSTAKTPKVRQRWKDQVMDTLPVKLHGRARGLLRHLDTMKNVSWTPEGEMIHQGRKIPDSHLVDLVEDVMRKQQHKLAPVGWQQFASALKHSNVPQEFITHNARRQWMRKLADRTAYDVDEDQTPRTLLKQFMKTTTTSTPQAK